MLPSDKRLSKAQALLEVLISLALFSILAHALFTLVTTSYSINTFNRVRITARHLAVEKIETIRNLPYSDIGTVGGIPSGKLPQLESVILNDINYKIKTTVIYIDDPADGKSPSDILPTDYKRISVEVSWEGMESSRASPFKMITDISPRGIESTLTGGILSIYVFDANANPVPQADVSIIADETSPKVNLSIKTDEGGRVILPGAPVCKKACYKISVSKNGYSSERTYSTSEVANPVKPNLSVLAGQVSEASFSIDKLGTLTIYSHKDKNLNFEPLGGVTFTLRGEKIIGTDSDDNPVYKYQNTFTTDSEGKKVLSQMEWDNYNIFISSSVGDISALNPPPSIALLPSQNLDVRFSVSADSANSVLISFVNPDGSPIATVSARLYDNKGFETTATSGAYGNPDFGQVFFSNLERKIYQLQATISGYSNYQGSVDSYGYKQMKIILNPI